MSSFLLQGWWWGVPLNMENMVNVVGGGERERERTRSDILCKFKAIF